MFEESTRIMNEDFVPFELAVKLKEKGFPQHWSNDDYVVENEYEDKFEVGSHYDRCFIPEHLPTIAAPTISQVLKWLREEKKIHIVIDFDGGMNWYYQIALYGLTTYEKESEHKYNSYEQAALAGIEYVLDNLI